MRISVTNVTVLIVRWRHQSFEPAVAENLDAEERAVQAEKKIGLLMLMILALVGALVMGVQNAVAQKAGGYSGASSTTTKAVTNAGSNTGSSGSNTGSSGSNTGSSGTKPPPSGGGGRGGGRVGWDRGAAPTRPGNFPH